MRELYPVGTQFHVTWPLPLRTWLVDC